MPMYGSTGASTMLASDKEPIEFVLGTSARE